jgi:hypothetical protein
LKSFVKIICGNLIGCYEFFLIMTKNLPKHHQRTFGWPISFPTHDGLFLSARVIGGATWAQNVGARTLYFVRNFTHVNFVTCNSSESSLITGSIFEISAGLDNTIRFYFRNGSPIEKTPSGMDCYSKVGFKIKDYDLNS